MTEVLDAVVANGGFSWPQLYTRSASYDIRDPRPPDKCAQWLRSRCGNLDNSTLMYEFTKRTFHSPFPLPAVTEDVASFLLVRGPHAYIGYGWIGCNESSDAYPRPPELDVDYGVPLDARCKETGAGTRVFTREWSKASVQMDCNKWQGTIKMKET